MDTYYSCTLCLNEVNPVSGIVSLRFKYDNYITANKNNLCLDFEKKWLAKENKTHYCKDCKYFKKDTEYYY